MFGLDALALPSHAGRFKGGLIIVNQESHDTGKNTLRSGRPEQVAT